MEQYKVFNNIREIYLHSNIAYFSMAVSHLLDKGFSAVKEITEEEIDSIKYEPKKLSGHVVDLMNEDFIKWIWREAKKIAEACEYQPTNLIMFCQAVDLFDTYHFNGELNKNRMSEMLRNRISNEGYYLSDKQDVETMCELYDCEAEEFEALGYEVTEEAFE